jgi:hypothetical protein
VRANRILGEKASQGRPGASRPGEAVVPLQLLAYRIAQLRGLKVDQPRNLAKTMTSGVKKDMRIGHEKKTDQVPSQGRRVETLEIA